MIGFGLIPEVDTGTALPATQSGAIRAVTA
jgi:hypothetical protein